MASMDQSESQTSEEIQAMVEEFKEKKLFSEEIPRKPAKGEAIKIELVDDLPTVWPPKALQGAPRKQPLRSSISRR